MPICVIDSTLREGRQSFFFDGIRKIQKRYLENVFKMGIRDIEYRNPFISTNELAAYKRLQGDFPKINFHVHFFLNKKNIDLMINDPSIRHLSTFIPFPLKSASLENLEYMLVRIKRKEIRVGIENLPGVPLKDLKSIFSLINKYSSVTRLGILDTSGVFTPEIVQKIINKLQSLNSKSIPFEFHLHNDYGLAAANAAEIMRITKERDRVYFSVSMHGVGERNGILSYGDLFSNMIRIGVKNSFNLKVYSELLHRFKKNNLLFNKDPLSLNYYTHFASSHILAELKKDGSYQNISPEVFGLKTSIIINQFTDDDVYRLIVLFFLNKEISVMMVKKVRRCVINVMKDRGVNYLSLKEVVSVLRRYLKD